MPLNWPYKMRWHIPNSTYFIEKGCRVGGNSSQRANSTGLGIYVANDNRVECVKVAQFIPLQVYALFGGLFAIKLLFASYTRFQQPEYLVPPPNRTAQGWQSVKNTLFC